MLLFTMTCLRAKEFGLDAVDAMLAGRCQDGLHGGLGRLARPAARAGDEAAAAALGQVVAHALLLCGREQQAEEILQKQPRVYEALPRPALRWMAGLDRGTLALALNRCGRACEHFNGVADDAEAPAALRVEALAGLAAALAQLGEFRRAERTLGFAATLCADAHLAAMARLVEACSLELRASQAVRHFEDGGHAQLAAPATDAAQLAADLRRAAHDLADLPLAAHRLAFLATIVSDRLTSPDVAAGVSDALRWLSERRLNAVQECWKVEAALAFVRHDDARRAEEVLGRACADDASLAHDRRSLEMRYCVSRVHSLRGRAELAFRFYREHASQSLQRLRTELPRIPYSRFLEKQAMREQTDALGMQLPLRYRRAYQFIIEHLEDRELSIRQVAAHIDVSERALQLAFRAHIGMTPAELIRRRRMECIRTELRAAPTQAGVLEVASRWGVTNRSTFAHNFRMQFGEAPTSMLRQPVAA